MTMFFFRKGSPRELEQLSKSIEAIWKMLVKFWSQKYDGDDQHAAKQEEARSFIIRMNRGK